MKFLENKYWLLNIYEVIVMLCRILSKIILIIKIITPYNITHIIVTYHVIHKVWKLHIKQIFITQDK